MINGEYGNPQIVAEIGCNHKGDLEVAKELIDLAADAGVRYVKFQKRNNCELLTEQQYQSPHPIPENSYGATYGEHREFLEFDVDQHIYLKTYCETKGVTYSTSVWDPTSARQIAEFNPEFIKVPSACNNDYELLKILRDEYKGQIQLSVGMTTKAEIKDMVLFFEATGQARERLVVYACTSGYPVSAAEAALLEIKWLQEHYGDRVCAIGFSGHHLGINLDVAAYTLGAQWIERHFTKDKTWKGTDHAASLDHGELVSLVSALTNVNKALCYKQPEILEIEKGQRSKLKREDRPTPRSVR